MQFQRTYSGAPWEEKVGYCRALRAGDLIFVTGTAPIADDGSVYAPGDAYAQTKRCFELIERALRDLEASFDDVVRTRMYVTDISKQADVGRAHHEIFAERRPTATMIEIKGLVDPAMLIEIEVDAVSPQRV